MSRRSGERRLSDQQYSKDVLENSLLKVQVASCKAMHVRPVIVVCAWQPKKNHQKKTSSAPMLPFLANFSGAADRLERCPRASLLVATKAKTAHGTIYTSVVVSRVIMTGRYPPHGRIGAVYWLTVTAQPTHLAIMGQ